MQCLLCDLSCIVCECVFLCLCFVRAHILQKFECFYEHKVEADERNALADRLRYDGKWYYRFHKVTVEFPDAPKIT